MRTRIVITAPFPTFEETANAYGLSATERKEAEKDLQWLLSHGTPSGARPRGARKAALRRVRTAKAARSGSAKK